MDTRLPIAMVFEALHAQEFINGLLYTIPINILI